jgi:uncharacterized membrane protein YobD (UPF0266 family)
VLAQAYPIFLIYSTTILTAVFYLLWMLVNVLKRDRRKHPSALEAFLDRRNQKMVLVFFFQFMMIVVQYMFQGFAFFLFYLLAQLADLQVNGNLQSCLYQARSLASF